MATLTTTPSDIQVNTYSNGDQLYPAICNLSWGNVVTWVSANGEAIYYQRFNEIGEKIGMETYVGMSQASSAPAICQTGSGFAISYACEDKIYLQFFSAEGQAASELMVVASSSDHAVRSNPVICDVGNGELVVAWETLKDADKSISYQRVDSFGLVGTEHQIGATANTQSSPSLSSLGGGAFVVSWSSDHALSGNSDIYTEVVLAGDEVSYSGVAINNTTANLQISPSVTSLSGGNFVIAWSHQVSSGGTYDVRLQQFDSSGTKIGAELLVNTYTSSSQKTPSVFVINDGFVVVWESSQDGSGYGVYGQKFNADGSKAGAEFRINTTTSSDQININGEGNSYGGFVVTWQSNGQDGDGQGLFMQRYDELGNKLYSKTTLTSTLANETLDGGSGSESFKAISTGDWAFGNGGDDDFTYSSTAFAMIDGGEGVDTLNVTASVDFTALDIRNIEIIRMSGSSTVLTLSSEKVYLMGSSQFLGLTIVGEGKLSLDLENWHYLGSQGDYNLWQSGFDQTLLHLDSGIALIGRGSAIDVQVNTAIANNQLAPEVCALANGGSAIAYVSANGSALYLQRMGIDGFKVGDETFVATVNAGSTTAMASLADGGFLLTYVSGNNVMLQKFDSSGDASGSSVLASGNSTFAKSSPQICVLSDGGYVLAWETNGQDGSGLGISYQRFNSDGSVNGVEQFVASTANEQSGPALTALEGGNFVLTWSSAHLSSSNRDVFMQIVANDGSLVYDGLAANAKVNTTTSYHQWNPSINTFHGGFVIAYDSQASDGSYGVKIQKFDLNGAKIGTEMSLNSYTASSQNFTSIASLNNGGYAAVWQSSGQDGSSWGIYGQIYDAFGNVVGSEFRINTTTSGAQNYPEVSGLTDGGFQVTWQSDGQDGSANGIFSQRFDANGNKLNYAKTWAGTSGTDFFSGSEASDIFTGISGSDDVSGYGGNDEFHLGTASASWWIDGGEGQDTIVVSSNLDLKKVGYLGNIEIVEISGANTVFTLTSSSAQTLSPSLSIVGASGKVQFESDWVLQQSQGSYLIYKKNGQILKIENSLTIDRLADGEVNILGAAKQGQVLTASNSLSDDFDVLGAITYTWKDSAGNTLGSANTLTLTQAHVGKAIALTASFIDGKGVAESVTSAFSAPVANLNDGPTGTVTISGTKAQNSTLTASSSTLADIDGLGTISYQWKANGIAISGATNSIYALTQSEVGKTITVTASYTDGQGTFESITSTPTTVISNVNDAPTGTVTISGIATQGQTLTASNSLADLDGLGAITYTWKNNLGTTLGTGTSLLLTSAQVGKTINVTASYTDGYGTAESKTSTASTAVLSQTAPGGTLSISGTALQGQTLNAVDAITDADGMGARTYTWKEGNNILGTGTSLFLTQAHVGKSFTVTATYVDGHGTTETVVSAATASVANINDAPGGTLTISGAATQGQTLSVLDAINDADGLGTRTYTWKEGVNILGTGSSLVLTQAHVGKAITVTATYTDAFGKAETVVSATTTVVANINDAPGGTLTINGAATQGQTLTVLDAITDADGLGARTYTWREGANTLGSGTSLLLTQAHVGKTITVTASYTDGFGAAESKTSAATTAVANINDAPGGTLTISGSATQGQTLTVLDAITDVDGLGARTYTWKEGLNTLGTGTSLVLTQAHVGKIITVTANYTDGFGAAESKTSAATNAVANINDAPDGTLTINGAVTQGQTLTVLDAITDADGLGARTYTWSEGANTLGSGTSLVLTQAQVGRTIGVTASYTDGFGAAEIKLAAYYINPFWSTATPIVANINDAPGGTLTISGAATQGQTLSVLDAITDADGLGARTYTWKEGTNILGSGTSLLLTQAHVGKIITVTASYTDSFGTAETVISAATAAVTNINDAPGGTITISGAATQGQTLSVLDAITDADGLGARTYTWKEGVNILGTGPSLVLTQAHVGKAISVTATYTDGFGTAETVISAATAAVANTPAVITGTSTSSLAETNAVLNASGILNATEDGLPTPFTVLTNAPTTYGTFSITSAGAWTYATSSAQNQFVAGQNYIDTVNVSTADGTIKAVVITITGTNDAATATLSINGTVQEGGSVSASVTALADLDGTPSISAYTWEVSADASTWNTAPGIANTANYAIPSDQSLVGKYLRFKITTNDGTALISSSSLVANVDDAATATLSITGTVQEGGSVSASIASLTDADGTPAVATYKWQTSTTLNGTYTDIVGATSSSYSIPSDQSLVGKYLRFIVSTSDALGGSTTLSSTGSLVANVDDAATATLSITGTIQEGGSVSASIASLTDADGTPAVATYKWQSAATLNGAYVDIAGATSSSYSIPSDQSLVGKYLRFVVTTSDALGGSTTLSSTGSLVANVDDAATATLSITGTVQEGGSVSALVSSLTDADGSPAITTYKWQTSATLNGTYSDIIGATTSSYSIPSDQSLVGKYLRFVVTISDALGGSTTLSSTGSLVANVNDAATASLSITGTVQEGGSVSGSVTALADPDGTPSISAYAWEVSNNGSIWTTAPGIANTANYAIPSDQALVGKFLRFSITTNDGTVLISAGSLVANVNDAATATLSITGTVQEGGSVSASVTALADPDGTPSISAYAWEVSNNGSIWTTAPGIANTENYAIPSDQSLVGQQLRFKITTNDGTVLITAGSLVANVNDAATATLSITGTAEEGGLVSASVTALTDDDGTPSISSYAWEIADSVNGAYTAISGASSSSYAIPSDQSLVGKFLRFSITTNDGTVLSSTGSLVTNVVDAATASLSINGTPEEGGSVSASVTDLADEDGTPSISSYAWEIADGVNGAYTAISSASSSSYDIPSDQSLVGKFLRFSITTNDGTVLSSTGSLVANVNDAATASLSITGTPEEGGSVSASVTALDDEDGEPSISSYTWEIADSVNGTYTAIFDATSASYSIPSDQSLVGKYLRFSIATNDGTILSSIGSLVTNINDAPTGSVSISGDLIQGAPISASNTLDDADGLGPITYTWYADGAQIAQGEIFTLTQAQVGKAISVTASYTDAHGTAESSVSSVSSVVANLNDAPTGSVTISGTVQEDQILTASHNLVDADGLGTISYSWFADGAAFGAGDSINLTQAQVGKHITAIASYTDGHGMNESISSSATVAVVNVNSAPTGSLAITGTPSQGEFLTATDTLADADGLGSLVYTWYANGTAIVGESQSKLLLHQTQVGKAITVSASYVDGFGTTETIAPSAATAAVVNGNVAASGYLLIEGSAVLGNTLHAKTDFTDWGAAYLNLADEDGGLGALTFTWKDQNGNILGTGSSYTLTSADVGKKIALSASYIDGEGHAETVDAYEATEAVVAPGIALSGSPAFGASLGVDLTLPNADASAALNYFWEFYDSVTNIWTAFSTPNAAQVLPDYTQYGKTIRVTVTYTDSNAVLHTFTQETLFDQDLSGSIDVAWNAPSFTASNPLGLPSSALVWHATVGGVDEIVGYGTSLSVSNTMTNVNLQIAGSTGTTVTSATIANGPLSGNWEVSRSGAILSVDADLTDPDGIDSLTYTWYKIIDGVKSYVDTGTSFNIDPDQGPKTQVGTKFSLEIAYRDDKGDTDTYTIDDIIIRNHDHTTWDVNPASLVTEYYGVGTLGSLVDADIRVKAEHAGEVSVSGQTIAGKILTADTTPITDDDNDGKPQTGFTYVWEKSRAGDGVIWQTIGGQSQSTLTLDNSLAGYIIRSRVEFKDLRGSQEISYSKATNVVLPLTPLELVGNYEFASQKIHSGNEASTLDQGNINRFEGDTLRIFDSVHAKDGRAVTKTVQWYKWGAYESPDTLATMNADCEPGTYYAVVTLTDINGQTKSLTSKFVTITSQNLVLPASAVTETRWTSHYDSDTRQQSEPYLVSHSTLHINHENLPFPEKSASYYIYTSLDNGNTWQRSHYYQYPNWHYDLSVGNEFSIGAWYKVTAENGLYHAESAPTYVAGGENGSWDQRGVSVGAGMIELSYANSVLTIDFEDLGPEFPRISRDWTLWASYDGVNFLTKVNDFNEHIYYYGNRQGLFNLAYTPEPGVSLIVTGSQSGTDGDYSIAHGQTLHSNVLQLIELDPPQNHAPISYDLGGALLKIGSEDISPLNHFKEGKVLSAAVNFGDADGFASSLDYTWRVSGVIVGYGKTLQLTAGMQGKTVTLEGSYTDKLDHLEIVQAAPLILDGNTPPVITRSLNLDLIDDQWHLITLADLQGKDAEDGEYASRLTFSTTALPAGLSFYLGDTPPVGSGSASSFTLKDIIQDKVWIKADVPSEESGGETVILPGGQSVNISFSVQLKDAALAEITGSGLSVVNAPEKILLNDNEFVDVEDPASFSLVFDASGNIIMLNDLVVDQPEEKKGVLTKIGDGLSKGVDVVEDGIVGAGKGSWFGIKWVGGKLWTGIVGVKDGAVWTVDKAIDGGVGTIHLIEKGVSTTAGGIETGAIATAHAVEWGAGKLWDGLWQGGAMTASALKAIFETSEDVLASLYGNTVAVAAAKFMDWLDHDITGVYVVEFDKNNQIDGARATHKAEEHVDNKKVLDSNDIPVPIDFWDGFSNLPSKAPNPFFKKEPWPWQDQTEYDQWKNSLTDNTPSKNHGGDQVHARALGWKNGVYSKSQEFIDFASTTLGATTERDEQVARTMQDDTVVFINGILNPLTNAEQLAICHGNTFDDVKSLSPINADGTPRDITPTVKPVILLHNDTNGILDLAECAALKAWLPNSFLQFAPIQSGMIKHIADLIEFRTNAGLKTTVIGHSEGSLILTCALLELNNRQESNDGFAHPSEQKYSELLTTEYHGAATNIGMAIYSNYLLGSHFKGMINDRGDLVGTILGMNSMNPLDLTYSLFSAMRLAGGSANPLANLPVLGDIPVINSALAGMPILGAQADSLFTNPPSSFFDGMNESPHTLYTRLTEDAPALQTIFNLP